MDSLAARRRRTIGRKTRAQGSRYGFRTDLVWAPDCRRRPTPPPSATALHLGDVPLELGLGHPGNGLPAGGLVLGDAEFGEPSCAVWRSCRATAEARALVLLHFPRKLAAPPRPRYNAAMPDEAVSTRLVLVTEGSPQRPVPSRRLWSCAVVRVLTACKRRIGNGHQSVRLVLMQAEMLSLLIWSLCGGHTHLETWVSRGSAGESGHRFRRFSRQSSRLPVN